MEKNNLIKCPNCNTEINVNEVLFKQLQSQFDSDYQNKISLMEKQFSQKESELEKIKNNFESEKKEFENNLKSEIEKKLNEEKQQLESDLKKKLDDEKEEFKKRVLSENNEQLESLKKELDEKSDKLKEYNKAVAENEKLKREKEEIKEQIIREKEEEFREERNKLKLQLESDLKKKLDDEKEEFKKRMLSENNEQLESLKKELDEKSDKLKEYNKTVAENEKLKREKEEIKEQIIYEKEKEFNQKLQEERSRITQRFEDDYKLTLKEREKTIEDMSKQIEELKKRAEQGSMQLQGEVQELEIERTLRELFPFDEINEVKKGAKGADVIQAIRNTTGTLCGKIYYESKRTKNFDNNWISKLKEDNLLEKADVLVIITEAMPEEQEKFIFRDGVWICSFREFRWFVPVLRYSVIEVHNVAITNQGRESKMEMLYNYLVSQEFRGQFEAIIEGFYSIQEGFNKEKMQIQKIWKEREKQLEKIRTNTSYFYGAIKGIAGTSIPNIQLLEMDNDEKLLE